jgi:hypothetical protein
LARYLQGLVLLIGAAGFGLQAAEPRFSHKVHLQMDVTCFSCHAKASTSTKATDDLLPSRDACARCHAEDYEIKEPRKLGVDFFNHQKHVDMAAIAKVLLAALKQNRYLGKTPPNLATQLEAAQNTCMACHRGMAQTDTTSQANFPAMQDCLVCHNQINMTASCTKCHVESPKLRPASHVPNWIDLHNRNLTLDQKQECSVCHGKNFMCAGCH